MNMIFYMGAGGSLLILGVMIFRHLFLQKLPKYYFVLLWLIVLTRLLLPVSIPVRWHPSVEELVWELENHRQEVIGQNSTGKDADGDGKAEAALLPMDGAKPPAKEEKIGLKKETSLQPGFLLLIIWLSGAAAIAAAILANHIKWLRRYRTSLPATSQAIVKWKTGYSGHRLIEVRHSDQISGPLTYGIIRPVILLPTNPIWENEDELTCILAHEYVHVRRFDIGVKYVMYAAVCVYWFNPLVWIMAHLLNRDLELSCDEEVIHCSHLSKKDYAMLLIRQAENQTATAATGVYFSRRSELQERIESIMKLKHHTLKIVIPAAAMVLCMLTVFTVSTREKEAVISPENIASSKNTVNSETVVSSGPAAKPETIVSSETAVNPDFTIAPDTTGNPHAVPASQKSPSSITGEDIVKIALDHVGDPYEFGGTNLETGVDCSGFVMAVYSKFEILLPHDINSIALEGTTVPSDSPAPGDVIIYSKINEDNSASPVHSAIYIGGGQVIHASNKREGVKISEIGYRTPYEIVRIIN